MEKYLMTRRFTGGALKGLSHTSETLTPFPEGFKHKLAGYGSPFVVVSCAPIGGDYTMPLSLNKQKA